jgi:hypothetical protein
MTNTNPLIDQLDTPLRRVLAAIRALRKDAAFAHHATVTAQMHRRNQAELHSMYLAADPAPDGAAQAPNVSTTESHAKSTAVFALSRP